MLLIAYVTANKLVGHYIEVPIKFSALILGQKPWCKLIFTSTYCACQLRKSLTLKYID